MAPLLSFQFAEQIPVAIAHRPVQGTAELVTTSKRGGRVIGDIPENAARRLVTTEVGVTRPPKVLNEMSGWVPTAQPPPLMLTLTGPALVRPPRASTGAVTVLAGKPTKLNSSVFVAAGTGEQQIGTTHLAARLSPGWNDKTAPLVTTVTALLEDEPPVMQGFPP